MKHFLQPGANPIKLIMSLNDHMFQDIYLDYTITINYFGYYSK